MSDHRIAPSAYRDGLEALLDERAGALTPEARRQLLPEVVRDLEAAEARLAAMPITREALDAAEIQLNAYEKQVELALAVLADLREQREAETRSSQRRRRSAFVVAGCLLAAVSGLVALGLYSDHRATVRREERRREAHFAGCRQRPECKQRGRGRARPIARAAPSAKGMAIARGEISAS